MIAVEQAKEYLRIPGDDEDKFIERAIKAGYTYLRTNKEGFGSLYAADQQFADMCDDWVLTQWFPVMYDQREGMTSTFSANINQVARSMFDQIKYYVSEEVQEDD